MEITPNKGNRSVTISFKESPKPVNAPKSKSRKKKYYDSENIEIFIGDTIIDSDEEYGEIVSIRGNRAKIDYNGDLVWVNLGLITKSTD